MKKKFKFQLGRDPLENKTFYDVDMRVVSLASDYLDYCEEGLLHSSQVQVWVVHVKPGAVSFDFASSKIVGYANDNGEYLKMRERGEEMTGVDAVTSLRKRGYLEIEVDQVPYIKDELLDWLAGVGSKPRSKYRFLIHRTLMGSLDKKVVKIAKQYSKMDNLGKSVLRELIESDELELVY